MAVSKKPGMADANVIKRGAIDNSILLTTDMPGHSGQSIDIARNKSALVSG